MWAPDKTYAVVVGVEEYRLAPRYNLRGPSGAACRFAAWLLRRGVPPDHVFLFLSPQGADGLPQTGLAAKAADHLIHDFITGELNRQGRGGLLYFYWAGHGVITPDHRHRLLFSDASPTNVHTLDLHDFLLYMKSVGFGLPDQVCIVDACAQRLDDMRGISSATYPHFGPRGSGRQFTLLATRPGELARNLPADRHCLMSQELLGILDTQDATPWPPDLVQIAGRLRAHFAALVQAGMADQSPTYYAYRDWDSNEQVWTSPSADAELARPGLIRHLMDRYLPALHSALIQLRALSPPPEYAALSGWLGRIRREIEGRQYAPTYLPLQASRVPRSGAEERLVSDPGRRYVRQVIRRITGVSRGGDFVSARIALAKADAYRIWNLLRTLLTSREPLVLLGDPGTGKTMTLWQVALAVASAESARAFPVIPILVHLGGFAAGPDVSSADVLAYVQAQVPQEVVRYFNALDRAGRLVILFDAMDEMGGTHYNAHTKALSDFASDRAGRVKTLFACRITNFSPSLRHSRLVLLPFDKSQTTEYLYRFFPAGETQIDGALWGTRRIAAHILSPNFPLEAENPYVLRLVCAYLAAEREWPGSRTQLLRFYLESIYDEKNLAQSCPLKREQLFQTWSAIAYQVTQNDAGTNFATASLGEMAARWGGDSGAALQILQAAVNAGITCGVLIKFEQDGTSLVRFENHRLHEYLTACHLASSDETIDWRAKLASPRWQETMLYYILLGHGGRPEEDTTLPIKALAADVAAFLKAWQAGRGGAAQAPAHGRSRLLASRHSLIAAVDAERHLADRVELSSRILRECADSMPFVAGTLKDPIKTALGFLVERGNPISQVKMVRACLNLRDLSLVESLQRPLRSPIAWVRDQALIAVGSSEAVGRAVGADITTELGYDLARGTVWRRMGVYRAVLRDGNDRTTWRRLALALGCEWLNPLGVAVLSAVAFLTLLLTQLDPAYRLTQLITSFLALGCSGVVALGLVSNPVARRAIWGSAGWGMGLAAVLLLSPKTPADNATTAAQFANLGLMFASCGLAVLVYRTAGHVIDRLGLSLFLVLARGELEKPADTSLAMLADDRWTSKGGAFPSRGLVRWTFRVSAFVLGFLVSPLFLTATLNWPAGLLQRLGLPLNDRISYVVLVCCLAGVYSLVVAAVLRRASPLLSFACGVLFLLSCVAFLLGVSHFGDLVTESRWGAVCPVLGIGGGGLALVFYVFFGLRWLGKKLAGWLRGVVVAPPQDPPQLATYILREKDPHGQARLLSTLKTLIGQFNLDTIYQCLLDVEPAIQGDPTATAYWGLREQVEVAMQQEAE
jgi:hypothetical protein